MPTRWFLILLLLILVIAWNYALAEPVLAYKGLDRNQQNVQIILYNEPCALKREATSNFDYRAVYYEAKKQFESCFAVTQLPSPDGVMFQIIVIYAEDNTFTLIPLYMFQPYRGV